MTSIPGFSNEQVNGLMIMISVMMDTKLEAYFDKFNQQRQQSNPIPTIETSRRNTSQPATPAKKKRNQKTRKHYKKKKAQAQAQAQASHVKIQVQEVESYVQEMEHSAPRSVKMEPGKHVVLQRMGAWDRVALVHRCWHAAIQSDWMNGMIMFGCGPNRMHRLGVG